MIKANNNAENSPKPTSEKGKFTLDVIWIGIAQIFGSLIFGVVTLPALTKNYSPEIFGIWSQAYVTVALLTPVFCMELDMAIVRFLAGEKDKTRARHSLGAMLTSIIVFAAIAFTIVVIFSSQLSMILFASQEYTLFVILTFLWVIFNALFIFFSAFQRARNRMRLLSIRTVMINAIIMVLVIGLASQKVHLEWIFGSVVAAYAFMSLVFFIMIVMEVGWPTPNLTNLKSYLTFSLPQIPGVILLWLIAFSDRYFITHFLGLSQAGIYSSSHQIASLTRLFYTPLTFVLYPTLSRLWDEKRFSEVRGYLEQSTRVLFTLGIPATVGIALLSQPLLNLLTTSEFLAGSEMVFLISMGALFLGIHQINGHIILLEKRTKILPLIVGAASITSVILNIILVPRMGIMGSGISNIISYFILSTIVTIWVAKAIGYNFDFKYLAKVVGATIPMAACLYFIDVVSVWEIILSIILGGVVYAGGLFLLKAFSDRDKRIIKGTLVGILAGYYKKNSD